MSSEVKDIVASIYSRLTNIARQRGIDFQTILQYYGMERFLYRLSQSEHCKKFILKGGLVLNAFDLPFRRVTRDIDFRGFTQNSLPNIEKIFHDVCLLDFPKDGLHFDPESLTLELTQVDSEYDGIRVNLVGFLGRSRIYIQIDIGFSDDITPAPIAIDYPCYLPDLPSPTLFGYPPETVIAEKAHSIIRFGESTSRLKDFYDIWLLSEHFDFDGWVLQNAIQSTFMKRQTDYPTSLPNALTMEFADRNQKGWERTVISKNKLMGRPENDFALVVGRITNFLIPPMQALVSGQSFTSLWKAGVDWQ